MFAGAEKEGAEADFTSFMSAMALMVTAPPALAASSSPGNMAFASSQPFFRNACGWMKCGVPFRARASERYLR